MEKLSVCLIVKNEERVLDRCLACVTKFADELIVVDTGSTDNSVEIAKQFTPYVFLHPWQYSFAEARNYSYSKATGDYIMWIDADDVISDENIARINALKAEETTADVIFACRRSVSETGLIDYMMRDRIIRRKVYTKWLYDIHEAILIEPSWKKLYRPDIEIFHKKEYVNEPERNMDIFNRLIKAGKNLSLFEKVNLIKELSKRNQTDQSLNLFLEIRDKLDKHIYAYALNFLIEDLIHAKRWQESLEIIQEAKSRLTPTAKLTYEEGRCFEGLGEFEQAQKLYKQATTVKDDIYDLTIHITGYNDYYPYLRMAMIANSSGDLHKALKLLDIAGKAHPNDMLWQNMRMRILMNVNKAKESKEKIKMAKTDKELNQIKTETENLMKKLKELSADELEKVIGGIEYANEQFEQFFNITAILPTNNEEE